MSKAHQDEISPNTAKTISMQLFPKLKEAQYTTVPLKVSKDGEPEEFEDREIRSLTDYEILDLGLPIFEGKDLSYVRKAIKALVERFENDKRCLYQGLRFNSDASQDREMLGIYSRVLDGDGKRKSPERSQSRPQEGRSQSRNQQQDEEPYIPILVEKPQKRVPGAWNMKSWTEYGRGVAIAGKCMCGSYLKALVEFIIFLAKTVMVLIGIAIVLFVIYIILKPVLEANGGQQHQHYRYEAPRDWDN